MRRLFQNRNFLGVSEFIHKELYFITVRNIHCRCNNDLRSDNCFNFFTVDDEICHRSLFGDTGPYSIIALYHFCIKLRDKLAHYGGSIWSELHSKSMSYNLSNQPSMQRKLTQEKAVVFYTCTKNDKRANAAFLVASFSVLYLGYSPCLAYRILNPSVLPFADFQDAAMGVSTTTISIKDCIDAIYRAATFGFFDFNDFNYEEFELIQELGDMTWIVPDQILAFSNPTDCDPCLSHSIHAEYMESRNVSDVIALNSCEYDTNCFESRGICHQTIFVCPGEVPNNCQLDKFFCIVENARGAVAIHCTAGLGRTGTFIAAYLIKYYNMSAREAIAWVRICRPGSVLCMQQMWLEQMECDLHSKGDEYRKRLFGDPNKVTCHSTGIYSYENPKLK